MQHSTPGLLSSQWHHDDIEQEQIGHTDGMKAVGDELQSILHLLDM